MSKIAFSFAFVVLSFVPAIAFAASVSFTGEGPALPGSDGAMDVSASGGGDSLDVTFSWEGVPDGGVSGSAEFAATGGFDLFYTGYTDLTDFADLGALLVSAAILEKINGAGDQIELYEGNATGDQCAFAGPDCSIVSGPGSYKTGSAFDELIDIAFYPDASTPIISISEGGMYRLTGAESTNPVIGFMSFEIQVHAPDGGGIGGEVPLPASLPLMLAGLGAIGLHRFRR